MNGSGLLVEKTSAPIEYRFLYYKRWIVEDCLAFMGYSIAVADFIGIAMFIDANHM